jgi:uncharacterized repeat protein (TIGR03806 family)
MRMVTRAWLAPAVACLLALASALGAACTDASDDSTEGAGGDGSNPPNGDRPPVPAEFGLDSRPPNPTCVAPARPPSTSAVKIEQVYANVEVEHVIHMAQPPGDKSRWFVASREGKIWSFPTTNPPNQPPLVANVPNITKKPIVTELSGGFLGFAFHPSFASNGRIYITFTTSRTGGYASEVGYLTSTDGGTSFTSYTKVFGFDRTELEFNGGGIAFGKDGYLYLSFGAGSGDGAAQNKSSYFGKILRIDVDNPADGKPYGIPTNNPFKSGGGAPEVYALGFRNPFRFSFDRETGDLWVGDVGQEKWEEIDKVEAGKNYGWPCREGKHDYINDNPNVCPSMTGLTDPVYEYEHVGGNGASVTGGFVYRGAAMPAFQGSYVFGDFMNFQTFALTFDAGGQAKATPIDLIGPATGFTGFTEDDDGEIYATTILENRLYKLVTAGAPPPSSFPERLSKTGCFDPTDVKKPVLAMIPYAVNAPLWSDGAEKERFLALPDGKTITVRPDGDFDIPIGSVLAKTFMLGGKRIETRLFIRHDDGDWAGYSYEWNDAETDAVLLPARKTRQVGDVSWTFPSRNDCTRCHSRGAGHTLGLELAQLNGDTVYKSTARISNQLRTLDHIGLFSAPLGKPPAELPALPSPHQPGPIDARARAYLHANCSICHRPEGNGGRAGMDFRFTTSFLDTKSCNVAPVIDDLGFPDAKIIMPGKPERSIVSLRTHATSAKRMPPLATNKVDEQGVRLLDDWIKSLTCP